MHLNTIIPHTRCYVRRTFLTAGQAPPDQLIECELIGAQSNIGRPIQFHVILRDGAVFYNLPIHAFAHHLNPREVKYNDAPTRQQLWDNPTATMVCTVWPRLTGLRCTVRTLDGEVEGEYVFSLDWYHADVSNVTSHPIEIPNERKCAQVIAGDDGLYYAAANNFVVWMDPSWVIESPPSKEDYRAIDKNYRCEHKFKVEDTVAAAYDVVRMADTSESFENAAGEALSTIWREGSGDPIDAEFTITPDPKETPANGVDGSDVPAMSERAKAEHQKAISTDHYVSLSTSEIYYYPEFTFECPPEVSNCLVWKIKSDHQSTDGYFIAKYFKKEDGTFETVYYRIGEIPF